jgi:hypothetical protein
MRLGKNVVPRPRPCPLNNLLVWFQYGRPWQKRTTGSG